MLFRWIVRTKIFFLVSYNACHCKPVSWFAMTPHLSGLFNKPTRSKPKHFDAFPAMRPGDSQGGGFSAAPLEPASYQCSCRDKNIASGGTRAEIFLKCRNICTIFALGRCGHRHPCIIESATKMRAATGRPQTVEKPCHCEAVRTLPWQSPEFSNILDPKPVAFTSILGIPTPVCGLVRNDSVYWGLF